MVLTTAVMILVILFICYRWFLRHDPRLPPCPVMPLPLVGHLLYLDKNPRPQFKRWRKQCGNIYSLYLGRSLVVVLNGCELIKEALVNNAEACSDRPYIYFDAASGKQGIGLAFSSGSLWREQRAITLNILRHLGMSRNILTNKVSEIVAINNEVLASLKGEPENINNIITTSVANVICSIILGHRFNHDDEQFIKFSECLRGMVIDSEGTTLVNFYPFLRYLPGDFFKAKSIRKKAKYILENFAASFVKQKGFDEYDENNLDNYIALYVFEMNKKLKAGEHTTMNVENLTKDIFDLFGAGTETVSATLMWCVLYMLHYPDIQEKVYREIQKEVGTERMPNMSDKNQLPYVNAVLMEVQRLASIVPLNILHACVEDVTIGSYQIPKGTQLIPSIDSIFFDKNVWGDDVNTFRPERFIDETGKVLYSDQFVPFSMGKRACAGEAMAKVELFMFFAVMIQRFNFLPSNPENPPSLDAVFGTTATPFPYKVRAVDRKIM